MKRLALDLGTNCGFAVGDETLVVSGVQSFKNDRYSGGGMRFLRMQRWLDEIHAASGFTEVVFEEVRRHAGTDAAHVYGGLLGILTAWCEAKEIPYEGIPVSHIKKFATGKGNADKAQMVAATRSWGYEPQDDNEADALALLHLKLNTKIRAGVKPSAELMSHLLG